MNFTSVAGEKLRWRLRHSHSLSRINFCVFTRLLTFFPFFNDSFLPYCLPDKCISIETSVSTHSSHRYCPSHLNSNTTHRELRRIIFPSLSTVLYGCKSLDTEAYVSDVGVCVCVCVCMCVCVRVCVCVCMCGMCVFRTRTHVGSFIRSLRIVLYASSNSCRGVRNAIDRTE